MMMRLWGKNINATNFLALKNKSTKMNQNIIPKTIAAEITDTSCSSTSRKYFWKFCKWD